LRRNKLAKQYLYETLELQISIQLTNIFVPSTGIDPFKALTQFMKNMDLIHYTTGLYSSLKGPGLLDSKLKKSKGLGALLKEDGNAVCRNRSKAELLASAFRGILQERG
ncbi:hypothetical protein COOONC_18706, partial [Cooperia oncophora]